MVEPYQIVIMCFTFFSIGVCAGGFLADWSFFHYPGYWIKKVKKAKKFSDFLSL